MPSKPLEYHEKILSDITTYINKTNNPEIIEDYQPEYINKPEVVLEGEFKKNEDGKSGAQVIMGTHNNKPVVLKIYPKKYIDDKYDSIIRECFAYINLQALFHDSPEYSNEKNEITFPELVKYGPMGSDSYYVLISRFVNMETLMNSIHEEPLVKFCKKRKNNSIPKCKYWRNLSNIEALTELTLKALKILYNIFGNQFIHGDFHPNNIFLSFDNNYQLRKLGIIDLDAIQCEALKDLPQNVRLKTLNDFKRGITLIQRQFVCSIEDKIKNTNYHMTSVSCAFKNAIFSRIDALAKENNINSDIKHWFITCFIMYYLWNAYQEVNIDNDPIEKRIIAAHNRMLPEQRIISKQNVYSPKQYIGRKARTQSPYSNLPSYALPVAFSGARGGKRTKRRRKTRRKQRTRNRRKKY